MFNVLLSTKWSLICHCSLHSDQYSILYIKALRYYVFWWVKQLNSVSPSISHSTTHMHSHAHASFFTFSLLFVPSLFFLSSRQETPESFSTFPFLLFPTCNHSLCPVSSNSELSFTSVPSFPSHCHPLISDSPSLWLGVRNLLGLSASCFLVSLKHPAQHWSGQLPSQRPTPNHPWKNYRPCPNCPLPVCLISYKAFSLL